MSVNMFIVITMMSRVYILSVFFKYLLCYFLFQIGSHLYGDFQIDLAAGNLCSKSDSCI